MKNAQTAARDARVDFRISSEQKRLIEQAASATGQSVSEFAVANLLQAAQRTLDEATTTRLSMRDRDLFLRLIADDAKPNSALRAAATRFKKQRKTRG